MGALPDRLPGFQHVENDALREKCEAIWRRRGPAEARLAPVEHVRGDGPRRAHRRCTSSARTRCSRRPTATVTERRLRGLDLLVVQDIFLTATAEIADVVLPGRRRVGGERGHGHQLRAAGPAGAQGARRRRARRATTCGSSTSWRAGSGHDWGEASAEAVWNEVRQLSPVHAGMSYARLEAEGGLQWPCYDENHPGELFLHSRLWEDPVPGNRAPFVPVEHDPPVDQPRRRLPDAPDDGPAAGLVQHGRPVGRLQLPAPEAARRWTCRPRTSTRLGLVEGERVRIVSRRGEVEAPVRVDPGLRPGLAFMTFHFQDEVQANNLTIDATDPKSGTAEFKATAIRIEKLHPGPGRRGGATTAGVADLVVATLARRPPRANESRGEDAHGEGGRADRGRGRCDRCVDLDDPQPRSRPRCRRRWTRRLSRVRPPPGVSVRVASTNR